MKRMFLLAVATALLLAGCAKPPATTEPKERESTVSPTYTRITQEEAARMMAEAPDRVILDVRRLDEYAEGHIPGAICVPNETIGEGDIPELPDLDQPILVYCRSGRRSLEAAGKLAELGYTRVYEFGGIIDWTGEVVQ